MRKIDDVVSKLIADVEVGEDVLILRGTEPAARLVRINRTIGKREFGALAGHVQVTDAFFEPLSADELTVWGE